MKHNHKKLTKIAARIYADLSAKYPREVWIKAYEERDYDSLSALVGDISDRYITIKSANQLNN